MTERQKRLVIFLYTSFWVIYFGWFWSKALFFDSWGNLVAGHVNIWGDWAAHITMGTAMAVRGPLLQSSPLLINQPFAYPFVSDMLSGLLLRYGTPLIYSFTIPSYLLSVLVVVSLLWFFASFFKSRAIAILATSIFMLNGGVGFVYFAQDIIASPQPVQTLINPPHEYTRYDERGLKWISVIDSMIIPQRAFALGFPIALIGLTLINQSVYSKQKTYWDGLRLGVASTLIGLLPILHTHSFLALFIILSCWSISDIFFTWVVHKKMKKVFNRAFVWLKLALLVSFVSIPLIALFFSKNVNTGHGFGEWYPGWLASDFNENWFVFWLKNWGATPIIATISWMILWQKSARKKMWFAAAFFPFFLLFAAANLWLFQPHAWDNTKLLVWTSVGFSGLAAYFIYASWRHISASTIPQIQKMITKSALLILLFLMVASGTIDAYYDLRHDLHSYIMFNKEELALAKWATQDTPTSSIWLTGDQHNHWLFVLTGRQTLMTYRGWQWTHGYNYRPVEADVSTMFVNPEKNLDLFKKYDVSYVVVGPNERSVWQANEAAMDRLFSKTIQATDYAVFSVKGN